MGIVFEDLKRDPILKEANENLEKIHGKPLPEPFQNFLLDLSTSSVYKVEQNISWVERTVFLCNKILNNSAHESEYPLFWIHLYAVVVEFYEDEAKHHDLNLLVSFKRPIMETLDAIRSDLTEDDLSLITFFRHSHCHMQLHYIWYNAKVKNGKIISVNPPFDPKAREVASKIISEHKSQNDVAFTYANKLIKKLTQLKEAVKNASAI
jgi:hypothetical protein